MASVTRMARGFFIAGLFAFAFGLNLGGDVGEAGCYVARYAPHAQRFGNAAQVAGATAK